MENAPLDDQIETPDLSWVGGAGFPIHTELKKWKGTRKFAFIWPIYSESLTLTPDEIHVKRNYCPALPRECRPGRSWSVVPIRKIVSFHMRKRISLAHWAAIVLFSLVVGAACGIMMTIFNDAGYNTDEQLQTEDVVGAALTKPALGFGALSSLVVFVVVSAIQIVRAPLRLLLRSEGGGQHDDDIGVDLCPGTMDPEEIKMEIDNASRKQH